LADLKNPIEQELYRALAGEGSADFFRPVRFEIATSEALRGDGGFDGVLTARWRDRVQRFGFQCKRTWSQLSMQRFKKSMEGALKGGLLPLLVTSYLSDGQLDELEAAEVSGIDLNGNGLLLASDLYVRRTGAKDRRKVDMPVSTVYRSWKVASLVPRLFVAEVRFPTVQSVLDACHGRMIRVNGGEPPLHLSTVSKALTLLEKDLVVGRSGRETRLLDPERLLARLVGAYRPPVATARFVGRTRLPAAQVWETLRQLRGVRAVTTGRGTAPRHTDLAGADLLQLYVSDAAQVVTAVAATATEAFPNLELIETGEEGVYFDARDDAGVVWASPLQTLLEISAGGAREVEAAKALRARMLMQMQGATRHVKE